MTLTHTPVSKFFGKFYSTFAALLVISTTAFGQFTSGNIVVLQAGDGSTTLASSGNQIILKEFSTSGTPSFSVAISGSVNPLIISGSASSEGALSLSANGKYLVFQGYATSLPYISSLAGATASNVNRGVGIVDAAGGYTRVAVSSTFHSGNNIRAAASDGNDNYWSAGANDGTDYFGTTSGTVTVQNANTNTKGINIFNGNLYFSTGSGATGIYQIGTGLPLTSAQTNSVIISMGSSGSPFAFFFNAAMTTCYIADDRAITSGGGIQKWVYSAGTWTLAYTLATGAASTVGARGVVVDFSGNTPVVYATTAESSANRLITIADAGAASTATTLATSVTNSIFRGLSFSPTCSNPQITAISNNGPVCANQTLSLNVTLSGSGPLTYTWIGPGSYSAAVSSPTLTNALGGTYSLTITNSCGTATNTVSVTVNPLPVLSVNSATICSGGMVTLTAGGASTYTWSTGSNSNNILVSPSTNTTYIISGSSTAGCNSSDTATVSLTTAPVISVNSATVCSGSAATLIASGVSSYSWSPGGTNTAVIVVTPSSTTVYTVNGSASGCNAQISTTAMVAVNPLPVISVNTATICAGKTATLTAFGAGSYSLNTAATSSLITLSPSSTTVYTVTGASSPGCVGSTLISVMVNPLPNVSLTPIPSVCLNSPAISLTATPAGGNYTGTGVNGTVFLPSASATGTYAVVYSYTDNNGCTNSDVKIVIVSACTGIEQNFLSGTIMLYPNPASEQLHISLRNLNTDSLEIFNVNGQKIETISTSETEVVVNVSRLAKGIYYVKAQAATVKFVKE